jgi:hypothetical protein
MTSNLDEVVMTVHPFTHENEVLALAPLGEGDRSLFSKQSVYLIDKGLAENSEVQWDFVLPSGKDWHFRQKLAYSLMNQG